MVNNLLKCHLGYRDFDDRDSYTNKRIELPGILLANLFRQYFSKLVKDGRNSIMKELGSWHNKINIRLTEYANPPTNVVVNTVKVKRIKGRINRLRSFPLLGIGKYEVVVKSVK